MEGTVASVPPQGGRKHPQQECIQIDTTNILFICGGAFEGLDKIISKRISVKNIGFNSDQSSASTNDVSEILRNIQPQDLLKFGLIPEFIGRIPVIVPLHELKEEHLLRILKEPKNSVIKQYMKLLEMDGVNLEFTDDAFKAIAAEAIKRNTGARGLRSIIEEIMLDVMFDVPSRGDVRKCIIGKEVVEEGKSPTLVLYDSKVLEAPDSQRVI